MALFTDGPAATIEDLAAQDSQLLNVANAEGIDLTVKLALTQEAIGMELEELLRQGSGFRLGHVVVTPALRLWHTYRTLEAAYRDAFHSQLNDRYAAKRDQFRELSRWAQERLLQAGVGIALAPVPRGSGLDLQPSTGELAQGVYYAAMAWVGSGGEEGASSTPVAIEVNGGGFTATARPGPDGVTGWNVFVGTAAETMTRQNGSPLAPGESWLAASLSQFGARPSQGQGASVTHRVAQVLQRG